MTTINKKPLYYRSYGKSGGRPIIFVHGLGATTEYFFPLISHLKLDKDYELHLYDFEGHGLSPTHLLSKINIETLAGDLNGIFEHAGIPSDATLIADGLGCLIALHFVNLYPEKVHQSILLSPPTSLLSEVLTMRLLDRAVVARRWGMAAVVGPAYSSATEYSLTTLGPLARAAQRISLLSQDPEGYARACTAFGEVTEMREVRDNAKVRVLSRVERTNEALESEGWIVFQDLDKVAKFAHQYL